MNMAKHAEQVKQQTFQNGLGKITTRPTLHKELQLRNNWEQEIESSPGKSTPIGYAISDGLPWKHVHTSNIQSEKAIFRNVCAIHIYM